MDMAVTPINDAADILDISDMSADVWLSNCGHFWLLGIFPFGFFSAVALGLICVDMVRQSSRKKLKWDGVLMVFVLFVASFFSILSRIETITGILEQ